MFHGLLNLAPVYPKAANLVKLLLSTWSFVLSSRVPCAISEWAINFSACCKTWSNLHLLKIRIIGSCNLYFAVWISIRKSCLRAVMKKTLMAASLRSVNWVRLFKLSSRILFALYLCSICLLPLHVVISSGQRWINKYLIPTFRNQKPKIW